MKGLVRWRAGSSVIAVVLLLVAGCGGQTLPTSAERKQARQSLAAARDEGAAVYFLGDSYSGLEISGYSTHDGTVTVTYGTCDAGGGDTGCATPFQVQTADYPPTPPGVQVEGCLRQPDQRGVVVIDLGGGLTLLPGTQGVTIFTDGRRDAAPAVPALQTLNGSISLGTRLPPTAAGTRAWVDKYCPQAPTASPS
jgi:hypothetical protein